MTTEINDITPAEEETPNHQSGQNIHNATVMMLKKGKGSPYSISSGADPGSWQSAFR